MRSILEGLGVEAMKDIRENTARLKADASMADSMGGALANAAKHLKTKEGRQTFQTLITAAVHEDGKNLTMSAKRMAEVLA